MSTRGIFDKFTTVTQIPQKVRSRMDNSETQSCNIWAHMTQNEDEQNPEKHNTEN